ncbi:GCN5-related N-acetyltransferase [Calothrix parasitica NIES-267]|uniref:GCN5-related N-acetyltransferase n=1 Tax=Calothrix parasitica NIES-267 TaxID=1973488 RepID=A0A1Z4LYR3_9CYAN|nr:GCN5-related N-acetyltransferase [Calothrix parasitica NIES-267]
MTLVSQTQIKKIAQILAESFMDDPSFKFTYGENVNKIRALVAFFELFVNDAIERGEIVIAPEDQGVCIWYPESVEIFNKQFEQILIDVASTVYHFAGEESGKRFEHLINTMGEKEPERTHCEVFFIGLKPEARGKGIGKNLIKPVLDYADKNQVGCYLVSSSYRNISFYKRHGFQKYCPIKISDSYSMTGMWRDFVNN